MAEYIERDKVIKELCEVYERDYPTASGDFDEYASQDVPNIIRNIPAADVQPVKRGHWIEVDYGMFVKCSECGNISEFEHNYCDECGADMRGEDNAKG